MATKEQNEMFRNDLYTPNAPLDLAIDWINTYMRPEEVFYKVGESDKLHEWALRNGYVAAIRKKEWEY